MKKKQKDDNNNGLEMVLTSSTYGKKVLRRLK